jgi:hypothetical protein
VTASADVSNLSDERLIRDGETAATAYAKSGRENILPMARGLLAARRKYSSNQEFGRWFDQSPYSEVVTNHTMRAALIYIGEHELIASPVIRNSRSVDPVNISETIRAIRDASSQKMKTPVEPTLIHEPEALVPVAGEIEETRITNPEIEPAPEHEVEAGPTAAPTPAAAPVLYDAPKKSKLHDRLGDEPATVLLTRFKHARMFANLVGGEGKLSKERTALRYLAERCVKPDYPSDLFLAKSWSTRLLYPRLPQKLLDMLPSNLSTLGNSHATLVKTEELFVKTPECGVTDPPMVAFNKARELYEAVVRAKDGATVDQSAVHRPTYVDDAGKPPVIVRGTQLWPAETGAGYGYDDLRCACGLADDILKTFSEPSNAPMSTKSLKLRHILSWFPNGYNSIGSTQDGLMKALLRVVQAYGADKSDVMRTPVTLVKLDE